jgi:hypothetical protein
VTVADTNRGRTTERAAALWLRGHGFPGAERTVRTGYRTRTRTLADAADLNLCPGLVAQVKSLRPASRAERAVDGWIVETEQQRKTAGAAVALLIVRREGTADVGEWWAWLPLRSLPGVQPEFVNPMSTPRLAARALVPVRLAVADACYLLRSIGYGAPPDSEEGT